MGLAGGVTGVITKPYEGAAKEGVGGFFKETLHHNIVLLYCMGQF